MYDIKGDRTTCILKGHSPVQLPHLYRVIESRRMDELHAVKVINCTSLHYGFIVTSFTL